MRSTLGRGFIFAVFGAVTTQEVDLRKPEEGRRWIQEHGTSVLDFGAGHLHETEILRGVGIDVTPFEPYRMGSGNGIDKAASIELTREFLEAVRAGKTWSSIFISSVLNSVPFQRDREQIVTLCSALCGPRCRVYAVASSIKHADWRQMLGKKGANYRQSSVINFKLDYETGVRLGDLGEAPKMQKYHTAKEFHDLFRMGFEEVKVDYCTSNVEAIAAKPLPWTRPDCGRPSSSNSIFPTPTAAGWGWWTRPWRHSIRGSRDPMKRVWLLDLNFTLVENSDRRTSPFSRQIEEEVYARWLIDLLVRDGSPVVLITARPVRYREATRKSILRKAGWEPDMLLFNDRGLPPPRLKPILVRQFAYPVYGADPALYFGLESNPATRKAYEDMGIHSAPVPKEGQWKTLPQR